MEGKLYSLTNNLEKDGKFSSIIDLDETTLCKDKELVIVTNKGLIIPTQEIIKNIRYTYTDTISNITIQTDKGYILIEVIE